MNAKVPVGKSTKKKAHSGVKRRRSGATKLAISFEGSLAAQVHRAAKLEARGNVSAWLAEAARRHLRQQALKQAIESYEAEHGVITDRELAEVRALWPQG
jgi:hypothetical protein